MNLKTHKIITAILNALVVVGSFEALITILNLNEPGLYFRTAFYVGLFFILQIILLYDLHYKTPGAIKRARTMHESVSHDVVRNLKIFGSALWDRCSHLRQGKFLRQWLNYLILPGVIFWSTIGVLFVNFGFYKIQQTIVLFSCLALFLNYWYLKEIFSKGSIKVDQEPFVVLSVVKIYASALLFGSALALIRYYCLDARLLFLGIFALSFLLVYQALFQHQLISYKNLTFAAIIGFVMALLSCAVLVFWGYNYFTAAIFLAAVYNLMWGVFHYHLDQTLTWHAFWEIFVISVIIAGMVFSVTNFRARILNSCEYKLAVFTNYQPRLDVESRLANSY